MADPPDPPDPPDPLPPLPAGLPETWVVREPGLADAPALLGLVAACDTAVLGYPDVALGDILVELGHGTAHQLVVLAAERPLAWANLYDRAAGRTIADLYIDPEVEREIGDRLAAWCWDVQVARAAQVAAGRGVRSTVLDVGVLGGDVTSENRLRVSGFEPRRTFWRMDRPLTSADAEFTSADGVTVRAVEDEDLAAVYDAVESAFADHWNHHPRSYAEWWAQVTTAAGADRSLWWLAEVGGEVVGALIATRQMADDDAIYIATLATVRVARGRGVGTSLLRRAFAAGWAEGWSRAKLNVDAENTTAAPALYARVGLTVAFTAQAWLREVASA